MTMSDTDDRVRRELEQIAEPPHACLTEWQPSLRCGWNRAVSLVEDAITDNAAFVPATGEIRYNRNRLDSPERWRSYLHELLHSYSVGTDVPRAYDENMGWEEAPVEKLQRLLRADVLSTAGIVWDEAAISDEERIWRYNPYIEAAESIRQILGIEPLPLCAEMLTVPLRERHFHYLNRIAQEQGGAALKEAVVWARQLQSNLRFLST